MAASSGGLTAAGVFQDQWQLLAEQFARLQARLVPIFEQVPGGQILGLGQRLARLLQFWRFRTIRRLPGHLPEPGASFGCMNCAAANVKGSDNINAKVKRAATRIGLSLQSL